MLLAELPPEAVRSTATWTMIVALLLLVFVVAVALGVVLRRGRRMRNEAQRAQQKSLPSDSPDPWYEAGRRARPEEDEEEDFLP